MNRTKNTIWPGECIHTKQGRRTKQNVCAFVDGKQVHENVIISFNIHYINFYDIICEQRTLTQFSLAIERIMDINCVYTWPQYSFVHIPYTCTHLITCSHPKLKMFVFDSMEWSGVELSGLEQNLRKIKKQTTYDRYKIDANELFSFQIASRITHNQRVITTAPMTITATAEIAIRSSV